MQAERLPGELETTIFRIVQEALTNVERHAESARAEVSITERDGVIRIEVRDRGVGFDPEAVVDGHFGLEGIRERARLSGGSAAIESAPGKGTTVTVELPIAAEDALRSKT
jgi:signal transduction histidine kinase